LGLHTILNSQNSFSSVSKELGWGSWGWGALLETFREFSPALADGSMMVAFYSLLSAGRFSCCPLSLCISNKEEQQRQMRQNLFLIIKYAYFI
jgi:hypothetical protein